MAEKVISHFCHEHPLILIENVGNEEIFCYGCGKKVCSESAYVCTVHYCSGEITLHKRCAELPRKISHESHPQHHLYLCDFRLGQFVHWRCALCRDKIGNVLIYKCFICNFGFDISCPIANYVYEKKRLQHPSHCHLLTLMRVPAPLLFNCDACGIDDLDMAYICSICEFWIHKACAFLPETLQTDHHQHPLCLAFNLPIEYRICEFYCDVCLKGLRTTCWVYYCGRCRYFAHVRCATEFEPVKERITAESSSNLNAGLIQFPMDDYSNDLITPFVIKARENDSLEKIPDAEEMPTSIVMMKWVAKCSLLFNYHQHPLSLVLEKPTTNCYPSMMKCDVCVTPVFSPPYYHCPACNNFFVHSTCSLLPETLSLTDALQLYGDCRRKRKNHKLTLYTSSEWEYDGFIRCDLCHFDTNGLVYRCKNCMFTIDVKCAALPTTIRHASHQRHNLTIRRVKEEEVDFRPCVACGVLFQDDQFLACCDEASDCNFTLDMKCLMLPPSVKHERDKHSLSLMYDASANHPTDFYCDDCETAMHPKKWMYYCRECDRSLHPNCIKTESGEFRNIKCGRQVMFGHHIHPHSLTLKPITLKLRCDACKTYKLESIGFECALCNFVLCQYCGTKEFIWS